MIRKAKRRKPETVKTGNATVKIYRRDKAIKFKLADGSPVEKAYTVFEVADYTSGRRVFRSFNDHGKARAEAKKIADQLSTGNATAAMMRNSDAASYGRAMEILRPTGISLEMAAATVAKCFAILGGDHAVAAAEFFKRHRADKVVFQTVADVVAELIEVKSKRTKKGKPASKRYIGDLKARLNTFAKDFAVGIDSVTTADIQKWIDGLAGSPQKARNFRTVIGTLFSFAESRGYIFKGGNPVESVEAITADGGAIEIFTPEEMTLLLTHAPVSFVPVLALGAFAGLRAAEIERLTWEDIDAQFIHVGKETSKTSSRRLVPILPNLAAWLAPYAGSTGKIWKLHANDLRDTRAETVSAAGTPWKDNGLRHSFISYRLADIQNAAQVALEAGNSPAMVFKHYREIVKPNAAKAWFTITPKKDGV